IAPSILSSDFMNLEKEIRMINESLADWIHVDVMDGVFVPNLTIGIPVVKGIKKIAEKPIDVHLMIVHPEKFINQFKDAGASILTVHYEACTHLHRTIEEIKLAGMQAGIALNPHTPVHLLEDIIIDLDMVLIMSVNPGFGGQKFINQSLAKIKKLKEMIDQKNPECLIEIDGGIYDFNVKEVFNAGVNVLVAGNAIFSAKNPKEMIKIFKSI
ncbi:ribulose-phosphate 3-epimerase, partial [Bacteroidota bacterium]